MSWISSRTHAATRWNCWKCCSDSLSPSLFQIFYPETTDIYDRKNMPRCIYCIHALRYARWYCLKLQSLSCSLWSERVSSSLWHFYEVNSSVCQQKGLRWYKVGFNRAFHLGGENGRRGQAAERRRGVGVGVIVCVPMFQAVWLAQTQTSTATPICQNTATEAPFYLKVQCVRYGQNLSLKH